uniref:Longin domain-containing protein n=1 Tax=Angiostrongylus cantonensis TaxID=6313 RepID=A0A0K0CX09_ANGCA
MIPGRKCSLEHGRVEESTASALSSTRVWLWASVHSNNQQPESEVDMMIEEEDTVFDSIDEEYDRLVEHHVCAMKAASSKVTERSLSPETLKLIRLYKFVRATANREPTSELAKQCRQTLKEDHKERTVVVIVEDADNESIRKAHRSFANYKTKMRALPPPNGTLLASRKAMGKTIYEYNSDLFDSHVHFLSNEIKESGYVVPPALPSEIQHAILSVKNQAAPGSDRISSEHLKNLPPVLVNTLVWFFTLYLIFGCLAYRTASLVLDH